MNELKKKQYETEKNQLQKKLLELETEVLKFYIPKEEELHEEEKKYLEQIQKLKKENAELQKQLEKCILLGNTGKELQE